jgi:hypothetical protein
VSIAISPPATARSAVAGTASRPVDPGSVSPGAFIITPAGDVADIRSRETGYSWVILGARDRTGRVDLWAYALDQQVELLGGAA